jgi:hypothetical protein
MKKITNKINIGREAFADRFCYNRFRINIMTLREGIGFHYFSGFFKDYI